MRIGVDFGGVLAETATPPRVDFLKVPPRKNSFKEIARARDQGDAPYLISKASNATKQEKARQWLAHWRFDELFEGMEFCVQQEGKISIAKKLEIDVMVDDTVRQQELLQDVIEHRLLFGTLSAPLGMIAVKDWEQTGEVLSQLRENAQ